MKKRILLSSIMMIVLCMSLVTGATFALFTSESKTSITISSGKVELLSEVKDIQTWSLEDDYAAAGRTDGSFTMGGSVVYEDGELTLSKVVPGDRVSFKVAGTNNSNVTTLYRVVVEAPKAYALMSGLEVTINGETYTSLLSYSSKWTTLAAHAAVADLEVSIELPEDAGNEYQDLEASLVICVEAVQGNAEMEDEEEVITFNYEFAEGEEEIAVEYVESKEELIDALTGASSLAGRAAKATSSVYAVLQSDLELDADETILVPTGRKVVLDLNGFEIYGESDKTGSNRNMIQVKGELDAFNGSFVLKHKGENMGWGYSTNIFDVTAGGVLKLEKVNAKNLGGSDMAFVAHLNNWGEVTLEVNESELLSTYTAVRVFNSGYDMNNVTLTNSKLVGGSQSFWVHNYTKEDFGGSAEKVEAAKARLNFNFLVKNPALNLEAYDKANLVEEANNEFVGKIRFGFTNGEVYYSTESKLVNNAESLKEELLNSSYKEVVIYEDITDNGASASNGQGKTSINVNGQVLDGQGNTLNVTNANATWDSAIGTNGGTIKNLTVNGSFRGIFISGYGVNGVTSDIIVENVVIDDVIYTISCDGDWKYDYSLIVNNSTLNGWTSYSNVFKAVEFNNCKFGEGNGYAFMRPYNDTTMENCEFEAGFEIDSTRATTTLINCYSDGQLITEENKVELLGSGASKLVIVNK